LFICIAWFIETFLKLLMYFGAFDGYFV